MDAPSIGTREAQWWDTRVLPVASYPAPFAAWHWGALEGAKARLHERIAWLYEIDARMRGYYLFGSPFAWLGERELSMIWNGASEALAGEENPLFEAAYRFGVSARRLENGSWIAAKGTPIPVLGLASPWMCIQETPTIQLCFDLSMEPNALWREVQRYKDEFPISRRRFVAWVKKQAAAQGVRPRPSSAATGERIAPNWDVLAWWDQWHVERLGGETFKAKGRLNRMREAREFWQRHLGLIAAWSRLIESQPDERKRRYAPSKILPARPRGAVAHRPPEADPA